MKPHVSAAVSFVFVFIGVFFLGGIFLMPLLLPAPARDLWPGDLEYWTGNWIGLVLGVPIAALSAWQAYRSSRKKSPTADHKELGQ